MIEPSWREIQRCALEAANAALAELLPDGRGRRLTERPIEIPPRGGKLEIWPVPRGIYWKQQLIYVVDPALDLTAQTRHVIEERRVGIRGRRLTVELSDDVRDALGDAAAVAVFYASTLEIKLAQALIANLGSARRGDLVAALWDTAERARPMPPQVVRSSRALNDGQRTALAAMSSPGGWFVWGPPGTGKTTVAGAAVREAVAQGRSVLIASALHVAVDNVVERLLTGDRELPPLLEQPGDVIRLASAQTEEKVLPAVAGHDFALIDKAAAYATDYVERRELLLRRRDDNGAHPARAALEVVLARLAEVDAAGIERALLAVAAAEQSGPLRRRLAGIEQELDRAVSRRAELDRVAVDVEVVERDAHDAVRAYEAGLRELQGWEATAGARAQRLRTVADRHALRIEEAESAHAAAQGLLVRLVPPLARARRRAADAAEALAVAAAAEARAAERAQDSARRTVARRKRECDRLAAVSHERHLRLRECLRASAELGQVEQSIAALRDEHDERSELLGELTAAVGASPDAQAIVSEAQRSGRLDELHERDRLNDQVAQLDEAADAIADELRRLDGELRAAKERLLWSSRVIATTVDGLSMNSVISQRQFDVVILDEGASIEPAKVAYVGSLARRTFVVVGDFLQNAPIAEVDARRARVEPGQLDWRRRSVFELAGIHDRASAERHPACVALRVQHRFLPIVADAVNAFCYDGLLQSARKWDGRGFPITLVDTAPHPLRNLVASGRSWRSPLGLDLMAAIAEVRGPSTGRIGFICPYAPQAAAAQQRSDADGLDVSCGTSHRFQGREFEVVIADLMQDDQRRWVGVADLHGDERAVSGAKLLNVALTRTQRETFLIADWDFVRTSRAPGMRAIAALEHRPGFRVLSAETVLEGARGRRARA